MKKKIICLFSAFLCIFFLASCGQKSTEEILNSTLDKLNSIENIDESLNLSCTIPNSSPITMKINAKAIPKESKFYADFSMDIMIMKLSMTMNASQEKIFVKFNDIFPKYIDMTDSEEGKEFLKTASKSNFSNSSSEYNNIFKIAFDEAKKNNTKLTKAKKTINGSEQSLDQLSLSLNSDELNNVLKSAIKDSFSESGSDLSNDPATKEMFDSLKVSDMTIDTYINKDYVPIYTEIKFKINIGNESADCSTEMIINAYDSKIDIPEVKESDIATPEELKNGPFSNIQ